MSDPVPQKTTSWFSHICFTCFSLGILASLIVLGAITYYLAFNDTVRQDDPITPDRARQLACPIPIPDGARKVRFAYTHTWFESTSYIRYNADSNVCQAQIRKVLEQHAAEKGRALTQTLQEHVTDRPKMDEWGSLGPLSWFSIEKINDGVKVTDSTGKITIWIDDDRGAFFCKITDY